MRKENGSDEDCGMFSACVSSFSQKEDTFSQRFNTFQHDFNTVLNIQKGRFAMQEEMKEALCRKIITLPELIRSEKQYLEALVRADRNVFFFCPRCGIEMQHPPIRKLELLRDYHDAVRIVEQAKAAYREQQDNIRKIGGLRTDIAHEQDERERLRLCIRAIAVMTGDRVFLKTELERLEENRNEEAE